ncbi:MAG: cupredoxin domain-containing protein [bacterium]|nr:cupredoxin domain-containing protein [bacterium]
MAKDKILVGIIIVLVVALGVVMFSRDKDSRKDGGEKQATTEEGGGQPSKVSPMAPAVPADLTEAQTAELKAGVDAHAPTTLTFTITAGNFFFTPNEIRVKEGDRVKIILNNINGTHNFMLPAFNIESKTIKTGETDTVEFVADKKGTFEFYCLVGNGYHRMKGQIGVLLVE